MTLGRGDRVPCAAPPGIILRRATLDDVDALLQLYANAGDMRRVRTIEYPICATRLWLAEQSGEIVAAALTNAETPSLAMIGGVYTAPSVRGRGYSQALCSALCRELLGDDKQPVLYWATPAAGAVYRKLGFRRIGEWRSVWLEEATQV